MNTVHMKKFVLMTLLSSALVGCGTFGNPEYNVSSISITSFNPHTPLGDLYAKEESGFWKHIRENFTLDHEVHRAEVQEQIRWLQMHPQYLYRVLYHSAPYLYFVSQEVKERKIPGEIALVPVVESSYNARGTNANSGAAGIWQLMAKTAQGFGLKRSVWYDGRRDIFASTDAALSYFKYLHHFFRGDWLLAIAAYDMGEGNVRNRMYNNYVRGLSMSFWNLSLPKETQIYVPRILALAAIIENPSRYHVQLPNVKNGPYFAAIELRRQISLDDAARLAEIPLHDLKELNPEYSHGATSPVGPHRLMLPIDKVDTFKANLATYQFPKRSWFGGFGRHKTKSATHGHALVNDQFDHKTHKVHHGETLASIAKRYGTSINELQRLNHLHHKAIKPGQILIVKEIKLHPYSRSALSHTEIRSERQKKHADKTTLHSRSYRVKAGDTLSSIANKFGVSVRALKAYNGLKTQHLHLGQKIKIPSK